MCFVSFGFIWLYLFGSCFRSSISCHGPSSCTLPPFEFSTWILIMDVYVLKHCINGACSMMSHEQWISISYMNSHMNLHFALLFLSHMRIVTAAFTSAVFALFKYHVFLHRNFVFLYDTYPRRLIFIPSSLVEVQDIMLKSKLSC